MHAVTVLQKCLSDVFGVMHAARRRVLLGAVEALLRGRRLMLMELARHFPGAQRVRAPLKRLDRLLGNAHLAREAGPLYAAMIKWLIRHPRPVIIVDWSALKPDDSLHLLRAGLAMGARTLTLFEAIYPRREKNAPRVERAFLHRLAALLPPGITPILVTDAGFRGPWFRAAAELGWDYIGRLRHRTCVKQSSEAAWTPNRLLHAQAQRQPRRFASVWIGKKLTTPWRCDLVLVSQADARRRSRRQHRKAQKANREPWLLATSLVDLAPRQIVAIYAKRMQIEQSFRDLKCDRFGCAFYYSLTRGKQRLAILLLLQALATFIAWLTALATPATPSTVRHGGIVSSRSRRHYSLLRIGWETLRRQGETISLSDLCKAFTHPPRWWLTELELPG
jgi:hypothetical protein